MPRNESSRPICRPMWLVWRLRSAWMDCGGRRPHPSIHALPEGIDYRLMDVLTITPEWIAAQGFDFICASSPCEQFSVHGLKCFHPNPPYPTIGLALFNHTRMLCETSGIPYIMENVRSAQSFVGNAVNHCGPFYLWGTSVPPLMNGGITKGTKFGLDKDGTRNKRKVEDLYYRTGSHSKARENHTADVASIPPELASCVVDYAERIIEQQAPQA